MATLSDFKYTLLKNEIKPIDKEPELSDSERKTETTDQTETTTRYCDFSNIFYNLMDRFGCDFSWPPFF
tara:strand:+ start:233 stop:439 length:207 start_codon:yes stop_codon:yes gene_type:complete